LQWVDRLAPWGMTASEGGLNVRLRRGPSCGM